MNDVFISYKTEEFEEANWVKSVLETNGISCWMAPESIPGGSSYAVEIPKAIRECSAFVLILSERSQDSQWISREVDRAINEGKVILPFMLENCELKDDFNFYLTNVQRYAAYESKTKAIEKMIKEIRALLGITHNSENTEPKESVRPEEKQDEPQIEIKPANQIKSQKTNSKNKLLLAMVALVAVVAIVIGVFAFLGGDSVGGSNKYITIAGEKFENDMFGYSNVSLENKTLTASDLDKLKEFKELSSVELINCVLPSTDINVVFKTGATTIEIINCGLTNEHLSSIDFTNLDIYRLDVSDNAELSDLSSVSSISELDCISFNNCAVDDLEFAKNLISLTELSASSNAITTLSPLSTLENLNRIDVSKNKLVDLTGIENCLRLNTIIANENEITTLNGLVNATILKEVNLSKNKISDISLLSKSVDTLQNVDIGHNNISDISALSNAVKMQNLVIDNNQISSLATLATCAKINRLSAAYNQISSIDDIKTLKFTAINLSNNQLTKVNGLSIGSEGYSFGGDVDLSNNQIAELQLKMDDGFQIDGLILRGNNITDFSGISKVKGSYLLFDYSDSINFDEIKKCNFFDYHIYDCPKDKQITIGEILGSYSTEFFDSTVQ